MDKPVKVLQVLGSLNRGGAESMVMNIYRTIDSNKIQFVFVSHGTPNEAFVDEIEQRDGKVFFCPRYNGKNHFEYCKWWDCFFREHKDISIVHSHIRSTAVLIIKKAKKYGLKTIVHSHSTSNGSGLSALVKYCLQFPLRFKADYYFGCTEEAGRWLFGKRIVKSKKYYTINNAIDVNKFSKNENEKVFRAKFNIRDNILVIGTVGRITTPKNPFFIVDIIYELSKIRKDFIFLWAGNGELKQQVLEKIKEKKVEKYSLLIGEYGDIASVMSAMDIFILPSLWEGLPLAVVEAQAAGLHCIISENVTKKVCLTSLVSYFSIENGAYNWAKKILETKYDKIDVSEQIINNGYDVNTTSKWLADFYSNIIKK